LNGQRLSPAIAGALASGATLIVANAQRQAAVRATWSAAQRAAGHKLWTTPRVLTFTQFAERRLADQWSAAGLPDRLLPSGAEWALLRELRQESGGGGGEARALSGSIRLLRDWQVPRGRNALGGSPEGNLLLDALAALEKHALEHHRKPLVEWLESLEPVPGELWCADIDGWPAAHRGTLQRLGARAVHDQSPAARVRVAAADDDEHELALIAHWCRAQLEQDPGRRLLVVDARLRQRRRQYERGLSQALSPSEWLSHDARAFSTFFSIEGGQPLTDFPLIAHALLTLRLLTSRLRFDEAVLWLRMPFLDTDDLFAGAGIEALLREGHKLEFTAASLAAQLERREADPPRALAARLRQGLALLGNEPRSAHDWSARLLAALRAVGWHGSRPLRSDEQQTVNRWYALFDEYSALGAWLPRASAADAVATVVDLARERSFDPASVSAAVTLTDSHDDPLVRYDAIWVAGLDAAQWPPPPRPDVFIPLRLQVAAGIPAASAAGQSARARASLAAWLGASPELVCSWARLDADAHRTPSPLLLRVEDREAYSTAGHTAVLPLAARLRTPQLEKLDDSRGIPVDTTYIVPGGVKPLTLQAECGFHAYGEVRLYAEPLEEPHPGIDPRDRGKLLHKALELVWNKLDAHFLTLAASDARSRGPAIADSVRAAITHVYHGHVPPELRPAVEREALRLERLIEALFQEEARRSTFHIESLETLRQVTIAGGTFEVRIDRIDSLQGGGFAILDYKTGEPRPLRWNPDGVRDPQLLTYLLAEQGRDVQALANISLTRGRAKFVGRAARTGLLPDVTGMNPNKVPADTIDATWQADLETWLGSLRDIARRYIEGDAPVQPAADVCRHCHLTVLCRRVELAGNAVEESPGE
jgi:probable DNA repair protein